MRQLVRQGKRDIRIRTLAANIVKHLNQKDWVNEIRSIQRYVRDNIRYVRDINDVETLQEAITTLELGYGDCDDKSVLVAALLESIGHDTRFIACGFAPNNFSHVFVETRLKNNWVTVETTEPVDIGWKPRGIKCAMVVHNS